MFGAKVRAQTDAGRNNSLAGIERPMTGIHSDFADFSASHELSTKRVATLEARVDAAASDSAGVRGEDSALRSQLSELRPVTCRLILVSRGFQPL